MICCPPMRFHHLLLAFLLGACGDDDSRGMAMPGDPCNGTIDCTPGSICYSNICVTEGALRFSMTWMADTDIDLHVLTPAANEIYFASQMADGGTLDVDDCVAGSCAVPDGTHVENVFFTDAAPRGAYEFWAENFDADMDTMITIEGFIDGTPMTYMETVPAAPPSEGARHMLTF